MFTIAAIIISLMVVSFIIVVIGFIVAGLDDTTPTTTTPTTTTPTTTPTTTTPTTAAAAGVQAVVAADGVADGTNPQQTACAGITCNGANRTKKSASEINAIPPTTDPDEYPDTTFRSPCCKWNNLPNPVEGAKSGINYTEFLNITEACPIDDSNSRITTAINAGRSDHGGNLCGFFTIRADADPNTSHDILNDDGKFEINFVHDNPNRNSTPSFRCPSRCTCPVFDSGQHWYKHHWSWGSSSDDGKMRCQDSPPNP